MLFRVLLVMMPLMAICLAEDNMIEWSSSRKLTWSDFQGKPDPTSTNAALTNSSIKAEFGYDNKKLTHSIQCRFNKNLSWGRIRNEYILNHEQGHFDLSEGYARILHRDLETYAFNSKTVGDDINKIYQNVMKQHVQAQQQYDLESNHSLDTAAQRKWDHRIFSLLKENQQYADYK